MTIKELQQMYNLDKSDFWELKRGGRSIWIIRHDAVERIASREGIIVELPVWLVTGQDGCWVLQVSGYRADNHNFKVWTTGEVNPTNLQVSPNVPSYPVAIAEKRAKDRLILKLINAYEFGIYSDSEADDFRQSGAAKPAEVAGRRDPAYFPDDERTEKNGRAGSGKGAF